MNLAAMTRPDAVAIDDSAAALARILDPNIHLAIWRRPVPRWLDDLPHTDWAATTNIDETVQLGALETGARNLMREAGFTVQVPSLAREVAESGTRFARIMGCSSLRFRLEVVRTDSCRKFHADYVPARLLMPLVGPGTQWMHAHGDGTIEDVAPGTVAIFKGRLGSANPRILHRSPPVAASGETRLLLAFDPIET